MAKITSIEELLERSLVDLDKDEQQAVIDALQNLILAKSPSGDGPKIEVQEADPRLHLPTSDSDSDEDSQSDSQQNQQNSSQDDSEENSQDSSNSSSSSDSDSNQNQTDSDEDSEDEESDENSDTSEDEADFNDLTDDNFEANNSESEDESEFENEEDDEGSEFEDNEEDFDNSEDTDKLDGSSDTEEESQDSDQEESDSESETDKTSPNQEDSEENTEEDAEEDTEFDDLVSNNPLAQQEKEQEEKSRWRKNTIARVMQAAEEAIEESNLSPEQEEALDKIQEECNNLMSDQETLDKMSDEQFNNKVNDLLAKIEKNSTHSIDRVENNAEEIKLELSSEVAQTETSQEDEYNKQNEIDAKDDGIKASEKAKETIKNKSGYKGDFSAFLRDFTKAIKKQVEIEEIKYTNSWSTINRHHQDDDFIVPGEKIEYNKKSSAPIIDIYLDCSGSWEHSDVQKGQEIVSQILKLEKQKKIKINLYFFANHVHTDEYSARIEGGTWAWSEILANIRKTNATNVVIMTDRDMNFLAKQGPKVIIDGLAWFLWKNGQAAPELPKHLMGKKGTYEYSFRA